MSDTVTRHLAVLASLAALGLAACGEGSDATSGDPAAGAGAGDENVEVDEDVGPGNVIEDGMFGLAFEGRWRFDDITQAAVVLESDVDPDPVSADLADQDGVVDVDVVDEDVVDERADLGPLLPPDEPTPPVLLVTAEDHGAAAELDGAAEREGIAFAFAPTCGALAGTARHDGVSAAEDRLEAAGCDAVEVIDADADAEPAWVAAAGVDDHERCIATASGDTAGSTCHGREDGPPMGLATQAGGFAIGFAPHEAAAVEIDHGTDAHTVDTVTVEEGVAVYAVHLADAGDDPDGEVVQAPDIGDIDARFLDEDGEVIDDA